MKKNKSLIITLILGGIAFIFIILDCFALFEVWHNNLPRESLEGRIVNISFIPIIIFYISFFITFFRYMKGYGAEYRTKSKSVTVTLTLFIISFLFIIFDFMALSDIGHGEANLSLEWSIVTISIIPFFLFFISFFLTTKKLLMNSEKPEKT